MALCPEQEDARRRVKELTEGRGADALHHVASGGRIVLAGVKGFKAVPEFLSDLFVVKEAHMLGAFGVTSPNYAAAIRLIESGRVPLAEMQTHDFALADAQRAIQTLAGEVVGEVSIHSVCCRRRERGNGHGRGSARITLDSGDAGR
jgi:threonine dehydrogenase-like Zn-dependent dehydrogenase